MAINKCSKCGKPAGFNPTNGKPNKLCKSCYLNQKGKGTSNGPRRNRPNYEKPRLAKSIDIDSLYRRLKSALEQRAKYQQEQDNLWRYIKRTENDRSYEMKQITDGIGKNTHEINIILNELTQYKKTHKAMNMAYKYLETEIRRIDHIIDDWRNTIREVEAGRKVLISSNGVSTTDTTSSRAYVDKKKKQLANLTKWQNHVKHYMV